MIDFDAITQKWQEIERRSRACETMLERATDTSVKLSDMPHGGGDQQKMANVLNVRADMSADLDKARAELAEMLEPLRERMHLLEKWQHREVIRKRYLEGKQVQQVADEIGYEISQIKRYLPEAREIINRE